MPRVHLRLFAGPREAVGARDVVLDVADGATVRDAIDALLARHPVLARWRSSALVSLNHVFVDADAAVADGDELAFMPPVSGGGAERDDRARIHDGPLSADAAIAAALRDGAGATVAFLGSVRADATALDAGAGRVERLEFEAYEPMAEKELAAVRARAVAKFGLVDAVVWHRVGTLETGEDIVLVVVTARHRREAFEAAAWIMDELKTVVPIWKKEVGGSGGAWVNDPASGGDAS